jgi:3-(3-hydroxy-phenyl)propionate hydroxylase
MTAYAYAEQPFVRPPELDGGTDGRAVAIVGAGPIGLAMAIDLAQRGVASVVLDDNNVVSVGSRAICWAKRTLEIFDRLGVGERMLEKGVTWKVGRNFPRRRQVYAFDLLPEDGHKYPAFVNLQQYYVEEYLLDRAREFPDLIDIRFLSKVTDHEDRGEGVRLTVETPEGSLHARRRLHAGLRRCQFPDAGAHGARFQRSDLRGTVPHLRYRDGGKPLRRPRHAGAVVLVRSALPSRQSPRSCTSSPTTSTASTCNSTRMPTPRPRSSEDRVLPRIRAIVGDKPFRMDWLSVYRFRCMMLERFVHGRVIFVGDSAHVVSPFGARGGNGGIQDVDNLGWKLAAVVQGEAPAH